MRDPRRFAFVDDPRLRFPARELQRYCSFLRAFGVRHAGEMVFRHEGRAVAGLSLIWKKSALPDSVGLGLSVQSYVEFNIGSLSSTAPVAGESSLGLTPREQEVAQLACRGCTNSDIARRLHIGLATVKTHLIHIFGKIGVSNRAALVSRMLSGSHAPAGVLVSFTSESVVDSCLDPDLS
jgi:DNA-binding CsgD family transcriptional regulator